jgi:muconolactone delta-isomerase
MGLMDRLKVQAEQLAAQAKEGTAQMQAQVQAKVDEVQSRRTRDQLLRDLGAAYYAEVRQQGSHQAVEQALAALDSAPPTTVDAAPVSAAPASGTASTSAPEPDQDFRLDDV